MKQAEFILYYFQPAAARPGTSQHWQPPRQQEQRTSQQTSQRPQVLMNKNKWEIMENIHSFTFIVYIMPPIYYLIR